MNKQITIRMPKADLEYVLKVLRDPENAVKQGKHYLFDGRGYCCLGLMQCAKTGGKVEALRDADGGVDFRGFPSAAWLWSVGWRFFNNKGDGTTNPYLPKFGCLASQANDGLGKSFVEIADAIEECAEGY